ncbi:MAG: hypothetical protein ACTSQY_11295 [Candidatus Odinarchaeia archaeon]
MTETNTIKEEIKNLELKIEGLQSFLTEKINKIKNEIDRSGYRK